MTKMKYILTLKVSKKEKVLNSTPGSITICTIENDITNNMNIDSTVKDTLISYMKIWKSTPVPAVKS